MRKPLVRRQIARRGNSWGQQAYLEKWHDRFDLYGEMPFLQLPAVKAARIQSFGAVMPDVATGNTTCLTQFHQTKPLDEAQKARLLLTQMSLALSGKKVDNKVVLSPGYLGKQNDKDKPSSAKQEPAVGHMGFLYNFAIGETLLHSLWFNLITEQELAEIGLFSQGMGQPTWEQMPTGEACETAQALQNSLMGRLVPLCRFCLLTEEGLHLTEGLHHLNYKEGLYDLSLSLQQTKKEPEVIWCEPERRPWRHLPALLQFIDQTNTSDRGCLQLKYALNKAASVGQPFGVWSGGFKISANAGEQFLSGKDDMLESRLQLPIEALGKDWFTTFCQHLQQLDQLASKLFGCVNHYYKSLTKDGKTQAAQATYTFWQLCERQAQRLIDISCNDLSSAHQLNRQFADYLWQTFDAMCPNQTARQLEAWAKCRPNLSSYLRQEPS